MDNQEKLTLAAQIAGYATVKRYLSRTGFIFEGLALQGKRILEVGCGSGAFCIWAAMQGAGHVLGIEPEADGYIQGTLDNFRASLQKLGLNNVEGKNCFFQDLQVPDKKFDIILMNNVINHLDENAVEILHKDKHAAGKYVAIAKELKKYLNPGSLIIVADCARSNFWNAIGLKSPVSPTIEWHKHQNPRQWIEVFFQAGYGLYDFRWSPLYPIGKLASNFFVQYMTMSHFVLRFQNQ